MGAMSEFVKKTSRGQWAISKPTFFKPADMIASTMAQFRGIDSDPMQMGRNLQAYDALRMYPATVVAVMRDMAESKATASV